MNFRVFWLPDAVNELAALWIASGKRNEVTQAATQLDQLLMEQGPEAGESRSDQRRIAFSSPLAVIFRYEASSHTILVSRVWEFRTN